MAVKEIKSNGNTAQDSAVTVASLTDALTAAEKILTKYIDAFEELAK